MQIEVQNFLLFVADLTKLNYHMHMEYFTRADMYDSYNARISSDGVELGKVNIWIAIHMSVMVVQVLK